MFLFKFLRFNARIMSVQTLLDRIITYFTSPVYTDDVQLAKKDFFGHVFVLDENMQHFQRQMSLFLNWYVFDYELKQTGLTPVEMAKEIKDLQPNYHAVCLLESLIQHQHSLFEFLKYKKDGVLIKDLITQEKKQICASSVHFGFNKGEYFEARLVLFENIYDLCHEVCFHPVEAGPFILKAIEKIKFLGKCEHKALMRRLVRMRFKCDQFQHIPSKHIYGQDPNMKGLFRGL